MGIGINRSKNQITSRRCPTCSLTWGSSGAWNPLASVCLLFVYSMSAQEWLPVNGSSPFVPFVLPVNGSSTWFCLQTRARNVRPCCSSEEFVLTILRPNVLLGLRGPAASVDDWSRGALVVGVLNNKMSHQVLQTQMP